MLRKFLILIVVAVFLTVVVFVIKRQLSVAPNYDKAVEIIDSNAQYVRDGLHIGAGNISFPTATLWISDTDPNNKIVDTKTLRVWRGQIVDLKRYRIEIIDVNFDDRGYVALKIRRTKEFSWEECLKVPGAVLQESYPAKCVTPDRRSVVQPLSDKEKKKLEPPVEDLNRFVCPKTGWIDCMPILTEKAKKSCTQEAIKWYRLNCSDFQGIAQ